MAYPELRGRLEMPLFFGDPTLHITVWHQFPGTLRNGKLEVKTDSPLVAQGDRSQVFSFEAWEPNEDQHRELIFRMPDFDSEQEIPLTISHSAQNANPSRRTAKVDRVRLEVSAQ